jgi:phage FluMu protein Com
MKKCPSCAEIIQTEAKRCRFCGQEFSTTEIHESQRRESHAKLWRAAPIFVVVLALIWMCSSPNPSTRTSSDAVASVDPKPCDDLLAKAERSGLIKERPSPERINVEDGRWADFPASSKRGLMLALRCSLLRGQPGSEMDYVVAYGYRSGRRVAMATSVGVTFE